MRDRYGVKIEDGRILSGPFATRPGDRSGAFVVPGPCAMILHIVAGAAADDPVTTADWDHVSVSGHRCPNWQEMSYVKDLFWTEHEAVIQFHPPKSQYVNFHPTCLHLWSHPSMPLPPVDLVGPRTIEELKKQKRMIGL